MANISDFYSGATKKFTVACTINGVPVNIENDTITFRIKRLKTDTNAEALLTESADVTSQGADGIAIFDFVPIINPGMYYCDIEWIRNSGAEYVLYNGQIKALERVSDP